MANEQEFQSWYKGMAAKRRLNPNADDPQHFYDYRAFYESGGRDADETGHFPSTYKKEGHPRMIVDGINTKTGIPLKKMARRQV